jgi:hypothetical protein
VAELAGRESVRTVTPPWGTSAGRKERGAGGGVGVGVGMKMLTAVAAAVGVAGAWGVGAGAGPAQAMPKRAALARRSGPRAPAPSERILNLHWRLL